MTFGRFWKWWVGELSLIFSSRIFKWRRKLIPGALLCATKDGFTLRRVSGATGNNLGRVGLAESATLENFVEMLKVNPRLRSGSPKIGFAVDMELCLMREVDMPTDDPARVEDILALDLERILPVSADRFIENWRFVGSRGNEAGTASVLHVVIRRSLVETYTRFKQFFHGHRLYLVDGDRIVDLEFDVKEFLPKTGFQQFHSRLNAILVAGLVVLALAYGWLLFDRQYRLLDHLDVQFTEVKSAVAALRAEQQARLETNQIIADLNAHRHNRTLSLRAWEEITRILPDTAWLTDLTIDGTEVTMSGFARSASDLIPSLERSDLFSNVKFASRVTKDRGLKNERFSIKMDVGRHFRKIAGRS